MVLLQLLKIMKILFYILLIHLPFFSYSQQKQICITIDDVPCVTYGDTSIYTKKKITERLIATFDEYQIPAIGYVNEGQLYDNGELNSNKVALLEMWLKAGYDLGNHTFAHLDYNTTEDSIYFQGILDGEKITRSLSEEYDQELKYFRHPYLHMGQTQDKYDSLSNFLRKKGYTAAPVTIDNDDYLFAKAYYEADKLKDSVLMKEIGAEYIQYMENKLIYFESKSELVFNRLIPQTLLIHSNLLNSVYLKDLAEMYAENGYQFVSQSDVLKDPAYHSEDNYLTKRGVSWIYRWGISKGFDEIMLQEGDVETPNKIIEIANN